MKNTEQRIIAGPCSLESLDHARQTMNEADRLGINTIRMNLWKPRTNPGFEGVGEKGIPWITEAAERGLTPALEILLPQQAELVMNKVWARVPHARLLLWIGSRNQNHLIQKDIGSVVAEKGVELMIKNQPWRSKAHWAGIVEHVMSGGVSIDQLLLCHRGFAPAEPAMSEMRNPPDVQMALELQQELGIPLIMDPSHIGGKSPIVKTLISEFANMPAVAGQIIEVHPNPTQALTDAKQQLSWPELEMLLRLSGVL